MSLTKYISDLLYRYECVIVPNFGGFVTNTVPSNVNHFTHTFTPPKKQITFNSKLTNNDGLLVNYIASSKKISYNEALEVVKKYVSVWNDTLNQDVLDLDNIGTIVKSKNQTILFEPNQNSNFLTSSFGLSSFVSPPIKRFAVENKLKEQPVVIPIHKSDSFTSKTPSFIKYAAAAIIILALGMVGYKEYQKKSYQHAIAEAALQQKKVNNTIQEATFVISNPLPAITLNVAAETHNYHIIAGAFREPNNAKRQLLNLKQKGFDAAILGKNKWGLTQVAYSSYNSKQEALTALKTIKKYENKAAWLLVKKY
ncbi:MAG: HU domain-containing protein [Lutibacter sp.]